MTLHERMLLIVRDALRARKGNRKATAVDLGISARSIRNWINRYDVLAEFRRNK